MTALTIDDLTVRIPLGDGTTVHAATGVNLEVPAGTVTALVGESGCGKSILAAAVMAMLPAEATVSGSITVETEDRTVDVFSDTGFRGRDVALIPQSASSYLTPVRTARSQIDETIRVLGSCRRCDDLARTVGLDPHDLDLYPHELSGGMAQRVAIAGALVGDPAVIVADEPTANLDGESTDRILHLLRRCADDGAAVLLITHDLSSLMRTAVADRVAVMYASRIMETGPAALVLDEPLHDYTQDLVNALPSRGLNPMPGTPPQLTDLPDECVYHLRRPGTLMSGGPTELVTVGNRSYRTRLSA
ncbi:ABC transporter ATP-binding protein [Rhodococcoides kyotonense]|uniref:Nickel import system ATP-binding protein NikD n=1 Tax=Rhodococcoides kyotonense TaxID=398843 RepID=A0A239N1D1_9NOCA|nr:ABC transporter ATP-binding protein [Rhodococcus kyotonensis]SNT48771.1 peptide/nickel transport system ATP-binding protein [Rhodococcus kyotonensis]